MEGLLHLGFSSIHIISRLSFLNQFYAQNLMCLGGKLPHHSIVNTSSLSLCLRSEGALREQISKPLFELPKFLINLDFTSRSHSFCDSLIEWLHCFFFLLGQGCSVPRGLKMIRQYLYKIIG